jgi:glycosyltransferase involved in cell wall biosynthesis
MRIATVITRSDVVGGASRHVVDLDVGLRARGHRTVVFVGGAGPFLEVLASAGVEHVVVPELVREPSLARDVRAVLALRRELQRWRPDLVATHTSKAGAVGRLAARSLGLPATYTPHDWAFGPAYPGRRGAAFAALERALAHLPRTVLVDVSAEERDRALARRVGAPHRHAVIHNGVTDVAPDRRADAGAEPPRIVVVARHEPPKDHATLLAALAELVDLPWTCTLVGGGDGLACTRDDVVARGLEGRVAVAGPVDDVAAVLATGKLLVES